MIEKTIAIYISDDGLEFRDKKDCEEHEKIFSERSKVIEAANSIKDYCSARCTGNSINWCKNKFCPFYYEVCSVPQCKLTFEDLNDYDDSPLVFPKDWEI